jgi:protein AATF/BFR2
MGLTGVLYHRPSKLRKLHESLNEPKYAGKKITRQLGDDISSAEEDDKQISEDDSESSKPAEEEEEPSQSDSDSEMEQNGTNHAEDLSNLLKRAKESDRAKGRAVSKQLVSVAPSPVSVD